MLVVLLGLKESIILGNDTLIDNKIDLQYLTLEKIFGDTRILFTSKLRSELKTIKSLEELKMEILDTEVYPADWMAEIDTQVVKHNKICNENEYDESETIFGPTLSEEANNSIIKIYTKKKYSFKKKLNAHEHKINFSYALYLEVDKFSLKQPFI